MEPCGARRGRAASVVECDAAMPACNINRAARNAAATLELCMPASRPGQARPNEACGGLIWQAGPSRGPAVA